MRLVNKKDRAIYDVSTADDGHGGFMIFAEVVYWDNSRLSHDHYMHYRTLAEFNNDWEDIN